MAPLSPFDAGGPRPRLLLLSWLNGGGAERVALHLMGHEALSGFDIRMDLLRRTGPYLRFADPPVLTIAAGPKAGFRPRAAIRASTARTGWR
jgi:hypothetical protein